MRIQKVLELIVYFSVAFLAGLFIILSFNVFVADSEFWSITLGYYFPEEAKNAWVYGRPLFYILIWISQLGYTTPSASVFAARALFDLNAIVILTFMILILRQRVKSYYYGALAVLLLLGNTGFMNQGFRVRSDLLATSLALFSIYFLNQERLKRWKFWPVLLFPLLATPKGFLQVVGLTTSLGRDFLRKHFLKAFILGLGFVALWLVMNWNNFDYVISSIAGHAGGPGYFTLKSFFHLINQFERNPLFWLVFFLRFVTWKIAKASRPDLPSYKNKDLEVLALVLFVLMFLYTEKVQFFIASFLPFFALHAALIVYDLENLRKTIWARALTLVLFLMLNLSATRWFYKNQNENSNAAQLKTLDAVASVLEKYHVEQLTDFTCLIAPACKQRHFVGPHQKAANDAAMAFAINDPPEVIFYIKKSRLLEPELSRFLKERYYHAGKGAFVLRRLETSTNASSQIEPEGHKILHKGWKPEDNILLDLNSAISGNLGYLFGYDVEF